MAFTNDADVVFWGRSVSHNWENSSYTQQEKNVSYQRNVNISIIFKLLLLTLIYVSLKSWSIATLVIFAQPPKPVLVRWWIYVRLLKKGNLIRSLYPVRRSLDKDGNHDDVLTCCDWPPGQCQYRYAHNKTQLWMWQRSPLFDQRLISEIVHRRRIIRTRWTD